MTDSQTVKYGHILEEGERGRKTYTILYIIGAEGKEKPHKDFADTREIASKWIGENEETKDGQKRRKKKVTNSGFFSVRKTGGESTLNQRTISAQTLKRLYHKQCADLRQTLR